MDRLTLDTGSCCSNYLLLWLFFQRISKVGGLFVFLGWRVVELLERGYLSIGCIKLWSVGRERSLLLVRAGCLGFRGRRCWPERDLSRIWEEGGRIPVEFGSVRDFHNNHSTLAGKGMLMGVCVFYLPVVFSLWRTIVQRVCLVPYTVPVLRATSTINPLGRADGAESNPWLIFPPCRTGSKFLR